MACDHAAHEACREIFWNVSDPVGITIMYALFGLSLVVFAIGLVSRIILWTSGHPDATRLRDFLSRFLVLWDDVIQQKRTNEKREARFHSLIFWGFLVLLFTTTMVFLDHDLGISVYRGRFYLAVTLLSDLFGLALLIGVSLAYHRRFIVRPDLLHSTRADAFMLFLLALMVVQGFGLEGLRIAVTEDPWGPFAPVGYLLSQALWPLSPKLLSSLHFGLWWFHTITVFLFIALLPYTKFLHLISSSANLFFRDLKRPKGSLRYPGDIEKLLLEATERPSGEFSIGVQTISDLTWKQRLDLDACTACGRCQEACPAYNSGKVLSPKWMILDLRDHMLGLHVRGLMNGNNRGPSTPNPSLEQSRRGSLRRGLEKLWGQCQALDRALLSFFFPRPLASLKGQRSGQEEEGFAARRALNPLVRESAREVGQRVEAKVAGEVMHEDVFWACTTCRACMEVCPVGIEHLDLIFDVRRSLTLMEGALPHEAQDSLRAIETRGNPFGPADARAHWAEGLEVRFVTAGDEVDVLYWVGCVSAYDRRKQSIVRSVAKLLNAAHLSWGILGNAEQCTGDPARRLGEENLFQSMAKRNIELLNSISFSTLIANCPHCFNTLKNEYGVISPFLPDRNVRILHHSEFLKELLDGGKLILSKTLPQNFTFHDPCYLGRYNDRYEEPRDVLIQLSRKPIIEAEHSRHKGMCCGAGGGHFWMDMKVGERVNKLRIDELARTGAEEIATACPFCLHMLEDGLKLTERESSLRVRDIAELLAEAI